MWWWSELEGDNLSLEDKICMKKFKISALVTNIHLTAIYHGNGNKNSEFILSGKRWNFPVQYCQSLIKLNVGMTVKFFITWKSPLIRKRPRNSELRNKLKFNKDNYRLRLVFKLISIFKLSNFENHWKWRYWIRKRGTRLFFQKRGWISNNIMCFSQVGFQIDAWSFLTDWLGSKTFQSQGDYLELAARVKELEHKVEPRWDFIKTFIIGLS